MSSGRHRNMKAPVDVYHYEDYQEKSLKEMLEDTVIVQLILMFVQIGMLFCRIFLSLIRDIIDGVFLSLRRLFVEDGELMLMMDYVIPFMYYVKTD